MNKAVLISIKPKWCKLIINGKKTIEVRKNKPKLDLPFKCYIYCTKGDELLWKRRDRGFLDIQCNHSTDDSLNDLLNQKVIGEFICNRIYQYSTVNVEGVDISDEDMTRLSCLSKEELRGYEMSAEPKENCVYLVGLYGWSISDLNIYDIPKELSEFYIPCAEFEKDYPQCGDCKYYHYECNEYEGVYSECECDGLKPIRRPSQSWCYVEEIKI